MSYTNAQVAAMFAKLNARLDALESAPVPAKAAPAKGKAKQSSTFLTDVIIPRAAAKQPCKLHAASTCNRRFPVGGAGELQHEARIV